MTNQFIYVIFNNVIKIKEMKKLTKSADKKLCGVCGGIAEYFGWDPTWVRLATAILACCYGTGLLAYIAAAIVIPNGYDGPNAE